MWGAQTLSNLAGIVSGPVALLGSRDGRTSRTSVGEREREGERGGGRGGGGGTKKKKLAIFPFYKYIGRPHV